MPDGSEVLKNRRFLAYENGTFSTKPEVCMRKINCDVVVVGAGPGGSMAAKTCAKAGLDTVLVERKETLGKTNCMMCYVGRRMSEYVKINEKTINSPVYGIVNISPDGTEISTRERYGVDMAYMLNRNIFDNEVAKLAVKDGAELLTKTRITGLIKEDGVVKGVKAKIDEKDDVEIRSNIVIGADGVESHIGRWSGIYTFLDLGNPIIIYTLENVKMDEEQYLTYWGYYGYKNISDGFFAILPEKNGRVVVSAQPFHSSYQKRKGQMLEYLNYFVKNHPFLEKSKVVAIGGGVGVEHPLKKFTTDNVMLVGDAAGQENWPQVPAGVIHAMDGGVLSGEAAVEAYEEGDFSLNVLSRYEKRYWKLYGEENYIGYIMYKFGFALPDEYINMAFHLFRENNTVFSDELFEKVLNSPKIISKILNELKQEGLEIPDLLSFGSLLKRYYRNYWDIFVE